MTDLIQLIQDRSSPLRPRPTGAASRLARLSGIRAVLLDVYGTLFVSGSGDLGTTAEASTTAWREAFAACQLPEPASGPDALNNVIRSDHERRQAAGCAFPEVDIVEIWRTTMEGLGYDAAFRNDPIVEQLAIEYETRANPCWPMPGLQDCLSRLRSAGVVLGIVSNAQFYTPLLFSALTNRSLEEWGFDTTLQFWSYRHGCAKPGPDLFELACDALSARGIPPAATLYLGNDMRNDVHPAQGVGFTAALFAGDERSLRLRKEDVALRDVEPDLVITELEQLPDCVLSSSEPRR